jgi:hypothetical protein
MGKEMKEQGTAMLAQEAGGAGGAVAQAAAGGAVGAVGQAAAGAAGATGATGGQAAAGATGGLGGAALSPEAPRRRAGEGEQARKGLGVADLMLVAVLLAVGAVLKFFVGNVINIGMKPNFIISMYCLAILLIRPRLRDAAIIGILAGAVCQIFPGQPYINFASELLGAVAMSLLTLALVGRGRLAPVRVVACTFLSTLVSGFAFVGVMYLLYYTGFEITPTPLGVFLGIIFGTATVNSAIVTLLYVPTKRVLNR